MEAVGVRELKARLSKYVEKASQGEMIVVTLRGREVATLGPVSAARATAAKLLSEGKAEWSGRKPEEPKPVVGRGGGVSEMIGEDRR